MKKNTLRVLFEYCVSAVNDCTDVSDEKITSNRNNKYEYFVRNVYMRESSTSNVTAHTQDGNKNIIFVLMVICVIMNRYVDRAKRRAIRYDDNDGCDEHLRQNVNIYISVRCCRAFTATLCIILYIRNITSLPCNLICHRIDTR